MIKYLLALGGLLMLKDNNTPVQNTIAGSLFAVGLSRIISDADKLSVQAV